MWRGRLPDGGFFYERYTFVDDSTIQMTSFPDSTLARPRDGDRIMLRGGAVRYENVVATKLDRSGIEFAAPAGNFGFSWIRNASGAWAATIRQTDAAGRTRTVVYPMERYTRARGR